MSSRAPWCLALWSGVALLTGCGGSSNGPPVPDDCPNGELFEATVCEEVYCGAATVDLGTGAGGYEPLADGDEVPIWYGAQGGYHLDFSAQMNNLCPIVFLRPSIQIIRSQWPDQIGGEDREPMALVFEQSRHVQAVRVEPDVSPKQQFWGIRGFVPCAHWPDDPNHSPQCNDGAGSAGHLEDFEVLLTLEAEDHNGRIATDSKLVQPVCCQG